MEKQTAKGSCEEIREDLASVSPLGLPQYLEHCGLCDKQDTQEVLDQTVAEFERQGRGGLPSIRLPFPGAESDESGIDAESRH